MLTSLPEASDDSSQNEQQGANHGDDRERLSKKTKTPEEPGDEPDPLRGYGSPSVRESREGGDTTPPTAPPTLTVSVKAQAQPVAAAGADQEHEQEQGELEELVISEEQPCNGSPESNARCGEPPGSHAGTGQELPPADALQELQAALATAAQLATAPASPCPHGGSNQFSRVVHAL